MQNDNYASKNVECDSPKEAKPNTIRFLQERVDALIPLLQNIEGQLDFQVNGNSTECAPSQEKGAAGTPNINTLHDGVTSLETRTRRIANLVGSLIGN